MLEKHVSNHQMINETTLKMQRGLLSWLLHEEKKGSLVTSLISVKNSFVDVSTSCSSRPQGECEASALNQTTYSMHVKGTPQVGRR